MGNANAVGRGPGESGEPEPHADPVHFQAVKPGANPATCSSTREKKKKMTGFATLRRKLIRRAGRRCGFAHKAADHGRALRDHVGEWSPAELNALVEEYDATAALKDLAVQADLARPPAATVKQDLARLLQQGAAADTLLVWRQRCYPAHRAILAARCPAFRDLLRDAARSSSPRIHLERLLAARGGLHLDGASLQSLLHYLYTGDLVTSAADDAAPNGADCDVSGAGADVDLLLRLGQEFGTPNGLEHDLRYLMETGELADAVLVFASGSGQNDERPLAGAAAAAATSSATSATSSPSSSDYGFMPWLEIPCHRAILSARSPFFRSLIQRRCRTPNACDATSSDCGVATPSTPIRIVLDESVIPRRYARVLMQALYLDTVDLNCIVRAADSALPPAHSTTAESSAGPSGSSHSTCSTGAVGTTPSAGASSSSSAAAAVAVSAASLGSTPAPDDAGAGTAAAAAPATSDSSALGAKTSTSLFEEATELYQIGRFLELDILSQGCEDVLVDQLCVENVASVLRWAELAHGSPWVRRQALHLLREEFGHLSHTPVLLELDKLHLMDALQSDFLQASELEVLAAVLRWGEHRLVRRMEEREPNVVSQTAHSVARKGVRRRDLNDVELRDILSELLPHVRVDHVLPPDHDTLLQAIRRGLVSTPPSHMIGGDVAKVTGQERQEQLRLHAWLRGKNNGLYVKPRLFTPYFDEAKTLLADQLVHEMERVRLRMQRMSSHMPDTLYMIDGHTSSASNHQTSSSSVGGSVAAAAAAAAAACRRTSSTASSSSGQPSSRSAAAQKAGDLDVVNGAIPVPDWETLQAMVRRERKLRQSALCQRAYSLPLASRRDINRQIRLRVVREFNLPDSIARVLESAAFQFPQPEDADAADDAPPVPTDACADADADARRQVASVWQPRGDQQRVPLPPKRMTSRSKSALAAPHSLPAHPASSSSYTDLLDEPPPEFHCHRHLHVYHSQHAQHPPEPTDHPALHLDAAAAAAASPTSSQLSEFIPDIALATEGAAAAQLSGLPHLLTALQPPELYRELQLDLGDGAASLQHVQHVQHGHHQWSMVRPSTSLAGAVAPPPLRLSTFRSASAAAAVAPPSALVAQVVDADVVADAAAAAAAADASHSPRHQRRSRSARAADVRVFI